MYKILVNATALTVGGSYNVAKFFINDIINSNLLESNKIVVDVLVSKNELLNYKAKNLNIILNEYPKKNYINRFIFENYIIRKLIKEKKYDAYLSLQNSGISHLNVPQFVLIQTPLPFTDIPLKYNLFQYWFILKNIYKRQMNNYDVIFVQTNWMKKAILGKYHYTKKVEVLRPIPNNITLNNKPISENIDKLLKTNNIKLFYPTSSVKYKNVDFLIRCVHKYNDLYDKKVTLYLTLSGESEKYIKYIGNINYNSIYNIYKNVDALIFPSLVETLGLPLQEALMSGIDVIAADLPYAREVVNDNGLYFNAYDENSLISVLNSYINDKNNKIKTNIKVDFKGEDYSSYIKYIIDYLKKNN